jgi:transcriptional regulator with XRE-family HTH domain
LIMALPTPAQIRAARGLLNVHQKTLSWWAGHESRCTISAYEAGHRSVSDDILARYAAALEAKGVEFIEGGVRLRTEP